MDLTRELEHVLDGLESGGIDYTAVGGFAGALYHGSGTLRSVDALVGRDDLNAATTTLTASGYCRRRTPRSPTAGFDVCSGTHLRVSSGAE